MGQLGPVLSIVLSLGPGLSPFSTFVKTLLRFSRDCISQKFLLLVFQGVLAIERQWCKNGGAERVEKRDWFILSLFLFWRVSPAAAASLWFQVQTDRHDAFLPSTNGFCGLLILLSVRLFCYILRREESFSVALHPLFGLSALQTLV